MTAAAYLDAVAFGAVLSSALSVAGMSGQLSRQRSVFILGAAGWLVLATIALAVIGALAT